jgi:WD40 repeat protein
MCRNEFRRVNRLFCVILVITGAWPSIYRADEKPVAKQVLGIRVDRMIETKVHLFVCSTAGTITILDARTLDGVWSVNTDHFSHLALSENGDRMATSHSNGTVSLWSIEKKELLWNVPIAVKMDLDSVHFMSGEAMAVVQRIDNAKGKGGQIVLLEGKSGKISNRVQFKNDYIVSTASIPGSDRMLVSYASPKLPAGEDRMALFDLSTGKAEWDVKVEHGPWLSNFDPKKERVAAWSAYADYEVHFFDTKSGKISAKVRVEDQFVSHPEFSPDGRYVFARSDKSDNVHVIDAAMTKYLGWYIWPNIQQIAMSRDGKHFYVASAETGTNSDPSTIEKVPVARILENLKKPTKK